MRLHNLLFRNLYNLIRKTPLVFIFLIFGFFATCIEPFNPDIDRYESTTVIVGELIETDSLQKVVVSKSSDYNTKIFLPVIGCEVYVEDDKGNVFNYTEVEDGIYTCHIEPEYINIGTGYRLVVKTSEGKSYQSKFDIMEECPYIDSVYYKIEKKIQGVDKEEVMGVQFYVNAKRDEEQTKYCRWSLDETWEYHALHENNAKLDRGDIITFTNPVWEPICWMSKKIKSVHTALIDNPKKPVKINYVTNTTPRLRHKYSLHIRQFGISEGAYTFWNALGSQFESAGDLYEKQPQGINTNIINTSNVKGEEIIGYFNTASVRETRIFIERQGLNLDIPDYCSYEILPENQDEWPNTAYLYLVEMMDPVWASDSACFDCTARGGTNIKPDFWED